VDLAAPFVDHGIDPIGTAGHYDAVLLVEWSLPWPRDIFDAEALADTAAAVSAAQERGERWRVLAAVPAAGEDTTGGYGRGYDDHRRLVRYRQPAGQYGGRYERTELTVETASVPGAIARIVAAGRNADEFGGVPGLLGAGGDSPALDVLICTHGSRDRRCGSLGVALHQSAVEQRLSGVRLWRISHTGGHRFAPTAITLPDGIFWSHLTPDLLAAVVRRSASTADVAAHVRGWAGAPAEAQPLDRAGLVSQGWDWLDARRRYEILPGDDGGRSVVLEGDAELPDGTHVRLRGVTGVRRRVPTVECDSACDDASSWTDELGLLDVAVVAG
jgi:hypothetical protein